MLRAIELGKNALGSAAPNPAVGCCIVNGDTIIGEGYTSAFGGFHAEVNAIQSVKDVTLLENATLYVTLEPCSHYGKTPPCSDLIIRHKIKRVVIGVIDPHEKVAGKGIEKLKSAGIDVVTKVKEKECRLHHKRFLTFHEKKRPYIILKWAQSSDKFIAPIRTKRNEKAKPYWITNLYSRQRVHQWRSEEQAIMVGTQTVLDDNPKLDVRQWKGNNPVRVVIDRTLKIPKNANVLNGDLKTIVFSERHHPDYSSNVNLEIVPFDLNLPYTICDVLRSYQINSLFIEGGAKTLQSFIDAGLWDEARIFTGNTNLNSGVEAPKIHGTLMTKKHILNDQLIFISND